MPQGDWFDAENWSNGVPDSKKSARIANGGKSFVTRPGAEGNALVIGYIFFPGRLEINAGGTLSVNSAVVGLGAIFGSAGFVVVRDAGSEWSIADELILDLGTLAISDGGAATTGSAGISGSRLNENNAASATVTVTGSESHWNSGFLEVGVYGTGTLEVTEGGRVNSESSGIAVEHGSSGIVLIRGAGSQWVNTNTIFVGHRGDNAELTVAEGGTVTSGGAAIAVQQQTLGKVVVDGQGSSWTSSGTLTVGQGGMAQLVVSGGAAVSSDSAFIALFATSEANVQVRGAGSRWDAGSALSVGYFGGAATMTIAEGGRVSADSIIFGRQGVVATATGGTFAGDIALSLGGRLFNDGVVEGDITVTGGSVLTGSGVFDGAVTVGSGGIVSPGSSPGTMTTPQAAWNAGGKYLWEINALASAGGAQGSALGWDFWDAGELTIGGAFTIEMFSSTGSGALGPPEGWDPHHSASWHIATAASAPFSSLANLTLDTSDFSGPLAGGTFSLAASADGRDLFVNFAAVPEVSAVALIAFAGLATLAVARYRHGQTGQPGPRDH